MDSTIAPNKLGFTDEEKALFDRLIVASMDSLTQIVNTGKAPNAKSLSNNFAQATVSMASQIILARRQELLKVAAQEYQESLERRGK